MHSFPNKIRMACNQPQKSKNIYSFHNKKRVSRYLQTTWFLKPKHCLIFTEKNSTNSERSLSRSIELVQVHLALHDNTWCFLCSTAVDCKWEEWGEWSPCPQVCGVSAKTRLRNQIEHICGGKSCEGKPSENKTCDAWAEDKETLDECATTSTKLTEDIKNLKTNIESLETNLTQTSDELKRLRQKLCKGIKCKNGGTCVEGVCQCPDGFSGKSCETLSCQCSTPGQGTAGKNAYKCGDGTAAFCAATEECYATQLFPKEATCLGCRKPGEKDPCGMA